MKPATVLALVGNSLVQQMLTVNLQHAGLLVSWEENVGNACEAMRKVIPDLIIYDSDGTLPPNNPNSMLLYQRARASAVPVITLIDEGSAARREDCVPSGWIVTKPFAPRRLLDAVDSALCPEKTASNLPCVRVGGIELNPLTRRVCYEQQEIALRPREYQVLAFLMNHVDHVFNRGQLLDGVWGQATFVDERTVDVLVRRLRLALAPFGLSERIETVRGAGYRFLA